MHKYEEGTRLYTKDGRKYGNGTIIKNGKFVSVVEIDGTKLKLTLSNLEIDKYFNTSLDAPPMTFDESMDIAMKHLKP